MDEKIGIRYLNDMIWAQLFLFFFPWNFDCEK